MLISHPTATPKPSLHCGQHQRHYRDVGRPHQCFQLALITLPIIPAYSYQGSPPSQRSGPPDFSSVCCLHSRLVTSLLLHMKGIPPAGRPCQGAPIPTWQLSCRPNASAAAAPGRRVQRLPIRNDHKKTLLVRFPALTEDHRHSNSIRSWSLRFAGLLSSLQDLIKPLLDAQVISIIPDTLWAHIFIAEPGHINLVKNVFAIMPLVLQGGQEWRQTPALVHCCCCWHGPASLSCIG